MKNFLTTEFKVGLFTIISMVILGYMLFVLSPDTFKQSKAKNYYTVVKNASGIVVKTHVKTNGVIVGKVLDVQLQVNSTRIELEISEDVKIPKGSKIALKEKGLLGDVFIEVLRADDIGEYVGEGGYLAPDDQEVSISKMISLFASVGTDVKAVTESLSTVLGGDKGTQNIEAIVSELKGILGETKGILEDNRADIRALVSNIEITTDALREAVGDNKENIKTIVDDIQHTSKDFRAVMASLRNLTSGENEEKLDQIIASFGNTMQDLEVTAKNVRLVADKIESGEGSLGKLINNDETISEVEETLRDIRKVLNPATKLQITVDYRGEAQKIGGMQNYFNLLLQTRPDKFYIVGFTNYNETVRETILEPLGTEKGDDPEISGQPTRVRERVSEETAMRVNLQIGKRWGDAQLRFGLFESTGGFASDFFMLDDRIRFTVEAFDWNSESTRRRTAHVKAYLSVLFFNHIYAVVGLDDPTRLDLKTAKVSSNKNYFLGAGFRFSDDDLKAVFGTAALASGL